MDANLEDDSFSFPYNHDDLFNALGNKDVTEHGSNDSATREWNLFVTHFSTTQTNDSYVL